MEAQMVSELDLQQRQQLTQSLECCVTALQR
jgi:hypothetical protein